MQLAQHIRQSVFLRQNAMFFVGSLLVGVLNYLYYPVIGRLLPPAAFGEVQTLISLFLQFTIFLNVLTLVTVSIVSRYQDEAEHSRVLFELERLAVLVALIFLVASIIFAPLLETFLQFSEPAPFIALALALVIGVPLTFRSAYLRGKQRFATTSWVNIVAAAGKLVFSVLLVVIGLGTVGAIWGVVGAQCVALAYAALAAKRLGLVANGERYVRLPRLQGLHKELAYAGMVLGASFAITLQYSVDVVVVKHFFDPHTAGLYAGIATVARIIFFVTASVAQVMMPSITPNQPAEHNKRLLIKSLALLGLVAGPITLLCWATPALLIRALMGNSYTSMAPILPLLSTAMLVIATLNILITYYIALRRSGVAAVSIVGLIFTIGLMVAYHATLKEVAMSLLIGSIGMLGLLGAWASAVRPARSVA